MFTLLLVDDSAPAAVCSVIKVKTMTMNNLHCLTEVTYQNEQMCTYNYNVIVLFNVKCC